MSESNFYDLNGRNVPRVSAILGHCEDKTGLLLWQERVGAEEANKIREEAALLGSRIHKALELERVNEQKFSQFVDTLSSKEKGMLANYEEFRQHFDVKITERKLHYFNENTLQEYAGTPDALGIINKDYYNRKGDLVLPSGSKILVDYKNYGKQKNIKYLTKPFLQLGAYFNAIHSVSTSRLDGCLLVTCSPRQLNLYYMNAELTEMYVKIFMSCLEHYYARTKFDWDGMMLSLGYRDMTVRDWTNIPDRVYDKKELEALEIKRWKKLQKQKEAKEFNLF